MICLHCKRRFKRRSKALEGVDPMGHFCTWRCGALFALHILDRT